MAIIKSINNVKISPVNPNVSVPTNEKSSPKMTTPSIASTAIDFSTQYA